MKTYQNRRQINHIFISGLRIRIQGSNLDPCFFLKGGSGFGSTSPRSATMLVRVIPADVFLTYYASLLWLVIVHRFFLIYGVGQRGPWCRPARSAWLSLWAAVACPSPPGPSPRCTGDGPDQRFKYIVYIQPRCRTIERRIDYKN